MNVNSAVVRYKLLVLIVDEILIVYDIQEVGLNDRIVPSGFKTCEGMKQRIGFA